MSGAMLLDTSGLLCCFDADDSRHVLAVKAYGEATVRLTHNYVLAEFVALAQARKMPRADSLAFAADILIDAEIEVVWVDLALHNDAMRLLQSQFDKSYSLADAVSFLLMRQRSLVDSLTTDRHFEQAGFRRLLQAKSGGDYGPGCIGMAEAYSQRGYETNCSVPVSGVDGDHSIWENPANGRRTTIPRHREIPEFTACRICRQLDVPKP